MSLTSTELQLVLMELAPLAGATLQKIRAPSQRSLLLELRLPGATHWLLLSAEEPSRLHLVQERPASPATPWAIQNLLRAHLQPARLLALEAQEGDRLVTLRFETPAGRRSLVAELIGRHGNLYLLDAEGRILGSARSPARGSRELRAGALYEPPPLPPQGHRPQAAPRFQGGEGAFPLSAAIEAAFGPKVEQREAERSRREVERLLQRRRKRSERALARLREDAARAAEAGRWRHYGDLLKPLLSRIPKGSETARALDYREDGVVEVELPLDPKLSAKENMERYYHRYRRLHGAAARIQARQEELEGELASVEAWEQQLRDAKEPVEVERILAALAAPLAAGGKRQRGQAAKRLPYRLFRSSSGASILVGRGARENDLLTFRHARGKDLWLHARGLPGAHVIIPLARGANPDSETLLDACALAAHFSGARGEAVAEISRTEVRHVRKRKGAPPGSVNISQERSLPYRHEEDRIARLLREEAAEPAAPLP